jgi:SAM-dependent methyltransferase
MTMMRLQFASLCVTASLVAGPAAAQQHGGQKPGAMDHMDHKFDDPERYAKSFDDPARDAWQMPARVIEALALKPGQKVADVGAGTGYFSVRLARAAAAPKVFAVDLEPKMVEHLTKRAAAEGLKNITAVLASTTSPNLPEPVDVVLVIDTYNHIGNRPAYFAPHKAKLKPADGSPSWTSARAAATAARPSTSASRPSRSRANWHRPATSSTAPTTSCRASTSSSIASSKHLEAP